MICADLNLKDNNSNIHLKLIYEWSISRNKSFLYHNLLIWVNRDIKYIMPMVSKSQSLPTFNIMTYLTLYIQIHT